MCCWTTDLARVGYRGLGRTLLPGKGHLTCVDVSKVWTETIQKRLKKYANVDYKLGEISAFDITDGAYDIMSCTSCCTT